MVSKAAPTTPPTTAPAISLELELFWFELLFMVADGVADIWMVDTVGVTSGES